MHIPNSQNYQCEDYCGYFGNAVIVPTDEDELYRIYK